MPQIRTFRIVLRKESEGIYTALVPSLPVCITWGQNVEHALEWPKMLYKDTLQSCRRKANLCLTTNGIFEYSLQLTA